MNYRHGFHAGNFADVLKHAVLVRILVHLRLKPAPFRVIDTHAGAGLYDLSSREAARTGEWRDGIGRVRGPSLPPVLAAFLDPYLAAVAAADPSGVARVYPGSPAITRALLRPADRLVCAELHPVEAATLTTVFAGDRRVRVLELDGWTAVKSLLPPRERRGVILVDPPYDADGDFARLAQALTDGCRRFATGVFVAWYPIKDRAEVAGFRAALVASRIRRMLTIELSVRAPVAGRPLAACGLVVVNPPWGLAEALDAALPALAAHLAQAPGGGARVDWLVPE